MRTVEETRALANLNPEFEVLLRNSCPEVEGMLSNWCADSNIQMARQTVDLISSIKRANRPKPVHLPYKTKDVNIPVRDGSNVPARVYTPRKPRAGGYPCMFVCQSGDYMLGQIDTEEWLCTTFASLGGVAVEVVYRRAPENVFPTQVHDSYDGLVWLSKHFAGLGINPAKGFIVAGETNGADIALAIAHMYMENSPKATLTGLYVSCPREMDRDMVPERYRDRFISTEESADAVLFSTEAMEFIRSVYKPDPASPLAYPVLFPDHSRMPKTYFQVCGFDPSRDCGLVLEQLWKDCGVETRLDIYPGLPNSFWKFLIHSGFTQKQLQDSKEGLIWLLGEHGCNWPEQSGS